MTPGGIAALLERDQSGELICSGCKGRDLKTLLIWASHDSTFLPVYSRQVLERFRELELPHRVFNLPCGHYTTGQFPFNLIDGLTMCRFAATQSVT